MFPVFSTHTTCVLFLHKPSFGSAAVAQEFLVLHEVEELEGGVVGG